MPEPERERVLRIKRGAVTALADVIAEIDQVAADVERSLHTGQTPLTVDPELDRISLWSVNAHRRHWGWS